MAVRKADRRGYPSPHKTYAGNDFCSQHRVHREGPDLQFTLDLLHRNPGAERRREGLPITSPLTDTRRTKTLEGLLSTLRIVSKAADWPDPFL